MAQSRRTKKQKSSWRSIAQDAQDYRDASIEAVQSPMSQPLASLPQNVLHIPATILSEAETTITETAPEELVFSLANGELTAREVTAAFLRRAAIAQTLTNCITELLLERALARADEVDLFYAENKRPIGPLHGLPISVKEMLGMKGLRQTAGYCDWWEQNKTASEDAHVLKILVDAGAILYARTTEPQTMMSLECHSNLYGRTVNPYSSNVSSGGSSGGEGALIGLRGSCLGIGTDVGGSIRSPAANCGIYGFKPTSFRVPTDGWSSIAAGADSVAACIGPLSTSLAGLSLFMQVVIKAKPWLREPALIPLAWSPPTITSLKLGIMMHDSVVLPHPPITRALSRLSGRLSSIPEISVVSWHGHLHDEAWAILSSLYYPDGGAADKATMARSGEPMLPLTKWMLRDHPCVKKLSTEELWYWLEEREEYRREYAAKWNETGVDAIICPTAPGVAPKHDTAMYWGYTAVWNLLDYPAAVFPLDKVDKRVDLTYERKDFMSGADEQEWGKYDPAYFDGLPIGLQIVGRRFEDEKVLAILKHMHKVVNLPLVDFP